MMTMKKLFKSLFVVIAATATFAGCQKEENNAPAAQTKTVEFFANSIETKTVFGESYTEGTDTKYPTLWTAGDKVKVYLNLSIPSGTSGTENSPEVELLEGTETSASAKFKAEVKDYSPESYTFYAVSPSDAANARTSSRVTVVIPTLQKPLATSPAKNAQIVYAISETTEEMPSSIDMDFHHFTAYGKLSFSNLASTSVSKVKIVAPADVCLSGKWNYLPADGTLAPHSDGTSNEITIETTSTSDIWFACGPVDVSGKTLKFIVTTDDGNLEKEITFPANRKFQSGHVAKFTVDMDGVTVPEPEETTVTLTKVTSVSQLTTGRYIIVSSDDAYYLPNAAYTSSNGPSQKSTTKINGVIQLEDDMIWNVTASGSGYVFESASVSGHYLVATSDGTKAIRVNNTTTNCVWNAAELSGNVGLKSSASSTRYLCAYGTSDWRYYASSSVSGSNKLGILYKISNGAAPVDPTPDPTPDPEPEPDQPGQGGETPSESVVLLSEDFSTLTSWSTSDVSSLTVNGKVWTRNSGKMYAQNGCVKFGTSTAVTNSGIKLPKLTSISGTANVRLTFKAVSSAGTYAISVVSSTGSVGTLTPASITKYSTSINNGSQTANDLKNAFAASPVFSVDITGVTSTTDITIKITASAKQWYIDEINVVTIN